MKTITLALLSISSITQAYAYDLPKQTLKSYDCEKCIHLSHDALHDNWAIKDSPLNLKSDNTQRSYSFKEIVTAAQLQQGVKLTTTAPGAVIRITSMQHAALPDLEIQTPTQQSLMLKEASTLYSDDQSLMDEAGSSNPPTLFQLKSELGKGTFTIKSKNAKSATNDKYVINVFDKFSMNYLQVSTNAIHYNYGDKLTATITIKNNSNYNVTDLNAYILSPRGDAISLELTKVQNNKFQGSTVLNSELNDLGENWYLEADITSTYDGGFIKRSGHAAFSYSIPSAGLVSVKKISSSPLTFVATVDVASASRYALQSVLFYKNNKGEIKPVETSQSARWLEQGKQKIKFSFDNTGNIADDKLYLGYLHLIDYGQLKPVYVYNQPIKLDELVD
jgi:hypothetical protein